MYLTVQYKQYPERKKKEKDWEEYSEGTYVKKQFAPNSIQWVSEIQRKFTDFQSI